MVREAAEIIGGAFVTDRTQHDRARILLTVGSRAVAYPRRSPQLVLRRGGAVPFRPYFFKIRNAGLRSGVDVRQASRVRALLGPQLISNEREALLAFGPFCWV